MIRKLFISTTIAIMLSAAAFGQCKHFAKKWCLPHLAPYTINGQLNYATLMPGQFAKMKMTFMPNRNYRILVCVPEKLGGVRVKITDKNNTVVYDNKKPALVNTFDFITEHPQEFTINFSIPKMKGVDILPSGCAIIMVGFKN